MAIVDCHECGNQVSDSARVCPKCGVPVIGRIRRELKVRLIMAGFAIVVAAICAFDVWLNAARIFFIRHALRAGFTIEEILGLTKIARWFLVQIKEIVDFVEELANSIPA